MTQTLTTCDASCEATPKKMGFWLADQTQALPGVFRLQDDLGIVRVSGKDAVSFLHGQLTNRLDNLGNSARLAGYCTPKGRLLATVRAFHEGDDILLMMPRSVAPDFIKRLKMYVLRSDVTFSCAAHDVDIVGLCDANAEDLLRDANLEIPQDIDTQCVSNGTHVIRVADASEIAGFCKGGKRYIVIAPKAQALFANAAASAFWWASEIATGIPCVWPTTREAFVPQAINFDLVNGVAFNKGCYPGQEIIARVRYLGRMPRRAAIGRVKGVHQRFPNDAVFASGEQIGTVIEAVSNGIDTLLLFEISLDSMLTQTHSLCADAQNPIELQNLPYSIATPSNGNSALR